MILDMDAIIVPDEEDEKYPYPKWSPDEEDFLRRCYSAFGAKMCCEFIEQFTGRYRSMDQLCGKAKAMRLQNVVPEDMWELFE